MAMTPGRIYPHSTITIPVRFYDQYGELGDPDTLVFKTRAPDGTISTATFGVDDSIEQTGTGIFVADFDVDNQTGRWFWRFESSSAVVASAGEGSFVVQSSPFYDDNPTDYGR